MSPQIKLNSRRTIFLIKTAACFFTLLLGSFVLSPTASMQDGDAPPPTVVVNSNSAAMSNSGGMMGNYKPTPEPPKSTVRGRVVYADTGQAVRRGGLMLMSVKGTGSREKAGVTNERGEFEIRDVYEGRYFMSVSTPGVLTPFSSLASFDQFRGDSLAAVSDISKDFQEIVVNGVNDTDVTIVVKRGAAITGKVMYADGEAAIGVRVEILRKKDGQYNAVVTSLGEVFGAMFGGAAGGLRTDDRGVFRIAGLPAGEYIVRAVENVSHTEKKTARGDDEFMAMIGFNPGSMVATYYPNVIDVKRAEVVKVELGQEQSEVNITIPERALREASGIVVNRATRQPIKGARVSIKGDDRVNSMFGSMGDVTGKNETDEQGRWSYNQLPAGRYTLTIEPPYDYKYESAAKNQQKGTTPPKLATATKEIVVEDKDVGDLTVELGYGASISGIISFDDAQAFSQMINVSATDENRKFSESDSTGSSYYDEVGKQQPQKTQEFKIEGIAAGKVFLYASGGSPSGNAGADEQRFYVKNIFLNGRDVKNAPLETKENEETKGVRIILSRAVGKLKGVVARADKSPAASARVLLVPTDKAARENFGANLGATTNENGEFEISGAPGEYFIVFYTEEDLNRDESKEKSVAEQRREWLEWKIADASKVTIKAKETEKIALTLP